MQFGNLHEIIDAFVRDGQSIALEGFTHLIPFAAGHELLRQRRSELELIRMTPDVLQKPPTSGSSPGLSWLLPETSPRRASIISGSGSEAAGQHGRSQRPGNSSRCSPRRRGQRAGL